MSSIHNNYFRLLDLILFHLISSSPLIEYIDLVNMFKELEICGTQDEIFILKMVPTLIVNLFYLYNLYLSCRVQKRMSRQKITCTCRSLSI